MFNGKKSLENPLDIDARNEAASALEKRLHILNDSKGWDTRKLFWKDIPTNWEDLDDNILEVIAAIIRLDDSLSTRDLQEWLETIINDSEQLHKKLTSTEIQNKRKNYINERKHAFSLILIEAVLLKLLNPERILSESKITNTLSRLSWFLEKSIYGNMMMEEIFDSISISQMYMERYMQIDLRLLKVLIMHLVHFHQQTIRY